MKNVLLIAKSTILFFFTVCLMFGCQELEIDSQGNHSPLIKTDVLDQYKVTAQSPQPIVFSLNSNIPWEVVSDQQWCHISPSLSGSSSLIEDIKITFDENTTIKERKATISIKGEGDAAPARTFVVIQEAQTDLKIQPIDGIAATDGGVYTFKITSNKSWKLFSQYQWVEFDKNEGQAGDAIEVKATILKNSGVKRTSEITVTLEDGSEKKFVVTQNGMILEFAAIEPKNLVFAGMGETKEYEVISTAGAWSVKCDDPTVSLHRLNNKIQVTLNANHLFITRKIRVLLEPVVPIADFKPQFLSLEQPTIFIGNNSDKIIANQETGAVVLNESTTGVILQTTNGYKYGTFTWKFAAPHNIQAGSFFEVKSICQNGNNLSFSIKLATNQTGKIEGLIRSGGATPGGKSFWGDIIKFPFSTDDLKQMESLKMRIEPAGANIKISVWVNGSLKLEDTRRLDPWKADGTTADFAYQFGFFSANNSSSINIKSCSFESI